MDDNHEVYLREDVKIEPLVNNWPAYPHIISPAPASMNIANGQVKIMKSFLAAPVIHAAAVKNPAMRGGPFMEIAVNRASEVRSLLDRTLKEQAHMIEFAEGIKALDDLLMSEAKGYSLEPLYNKVPEALKGYVELVFDLNNNPSIRFIEGLLYKSRYYNKDSQGVALSIINSDQRPFMFCTPLLEDGEHLHLKLPFDDQALDILSELRSTPKPLGHVKEALGIDRERHDTFSRFLTDKAPPQPSKKQSEAMRVRYFGHACVLIESRGLTILTDPSISYKYETELGRYTYTDLPDAIDYVLITHCHSDHTVIETLLQLRHKIKNIVVPRNGSGALEDPSLKLLLKALGFKSVIDLEEMETIELEGGTITSLPFLGEHCDLRVRSKNAFHVRMEGKSFIFAADSRNLEFKLYEHLHSLIGDVDAMFLGMECDGAPLSWIYGSLLTRPIDRRMDQSRRLSGSDYERAVDIVNRLNCKKVFVYAMGQEPWLSHIMALQYTNESNPIVESNKLIKDCQSRGIPAERLFAAKDYLT